MSERKLTKEERIALRKRVADMIYKNDSLSGNKEEFESATIAERLLVDLDAAGEEIAKLRSENERMKTLLNAYGAAEQLAMARKGQL